ncbi:MAG: PTS sugar transporter subunit IIA [Victivallaceae bacterium]|nr:PTS sugar transporter subunit IIA [Victivallaceae bacterium]
MPLIMPDLCNGDAALKNILIISRNGKFSKWSKQHDFLVGNRTSYGIYVLGQQMEDIDGSLLQQENIHFCKVSTKDMTRELKRLFNETKIDFVVIDYDEDYREMQRWFNVLRDDIPVVVVKLNRLPDADRILIPVCGGNNVTQLLWFVHLVASNLKLPVHLLHIRTNPGKTDNCQLFNDLIARSYGIYSCGELIAFNITNGILNKIRNNDIVIMGAPNYWQLTTQFNYSIPYGVFNKEHDAMMLIAPSPAKIRLRDVMWHELINLDLKAKDKESAISQMVELLIQANQITEGQRKDVLKRVFERERECTTGVGEDTAFPHLTMPGGSSVICCMGIFPDGVAFGPGDEKNVKFIFLILSPQDDYTEYLSVLSQITRNMIDENKRNRLLKATSSWEILNIMQALDK